AAAHHPISTTAATTLTQRDRPALPLAFSVTISLLLSLPERCDLSSHMEFLLPQNDGSRISELTGPQRDGAEGSVQNGRFIAAVPALKSPAVRSTFATPRTGSSGGVPPPAGRRIALPNVVPRPPIDIGNGGPKSGPSSVSENQQSTGTGNTERFSSNSLRTGTDSVVWDGTRFSKSIPQGTRETFVLTIEGVLVAESIARSLDPSAVKFR